MKEVIVERVVRVTEIVKMTNEEADIYAQQVKTVDDQRAWAKEAESALGADDVVVDKVKVFINNRFYPEPEKESKPKKSRKKKEQ